MASSEDNKTIELKTSELKEMSQEGVVEDPKNLTVGLLSTDLVEIKPGGAVELDAKIEVDTGLMPRPIMPNPEAKITKSAEPTQHVDRLPSAAASLRNRIMIIGLYFLATLALGLAILSRF